jgi:hypothetical protein
MDHMDYRRYNRNYLVSVFFESKRSVIKPMRLSSQEPNQSITLNSVGKVGSTVYLALEYVLNVACYLASGNRAKDGIVKACSPAKVRNAI